MNILNTITRSRTLVLPLILAFSLGLTACTDELVSEGPADTFTLAETVSNPDFATLNAALEAADLTAVLSQDGPYTLFAPTNDAFAQLPDGLVEALLLPENKGILAAILTYHVVPGEIYAEEISNVSSAKTAQGEDLVISLEGQEVLINNARVTDTNIVAENGVKHVIDSVLLPEGVADGLLRILPQAIPFDDE